MLENVLLLIPAFSIFFLILGVYKLILEKRFIAQENVLGIMANKGRLNAGSPLLNDRILKKLNANQKSLLYKIEMKLELANMLLKPMEYILISLGFSTFCFLVFLAVSHNFIVALLFGLISLVVPYAYLNIKIWLRLKKAAEQFSEVMDTMVTCFKTGYGLNRALSVVADKYTDPWGTEFEKIIAEINLGSSLEDALENLFERMPTPDVELFVSAILIQKDTGGNLGEVLGNLSKTCRNRYQFFRTIQTISAQGKLSALVVSCVPFFLMLMMFCLLPKAVTEFVTNPIGIILLILMGGWMLMGYGVLYKTVQIEV